ncbi:PUA-like domain-containing protein [Aspergillus cavernicola]|uniref:PUA-like domain-containing protein n=1 Tax=Aspergillus cavernicola TaxID=176166 RepID=A0ABR4J374_9EURO
MEDVTSPHSPSRGRGDGDRDTGDRDDSSHSSPRCTTPHSSSPDPLSTPIRIGNDTTPPPHSVVRLIQCSRCSLPFRAPLRLPCGNTLCRSCLPLIRPRIGVSYPASEERKQGFTCFWGKGRGGCGADHCLGDCGADVLLTRLVDVFDGVLGSGLDGAVVKGDVESTVMWEQSSPDSVEASLESAGIGPDQLRGIYGLVKRGRFTYDASEIRYKHLAHASHDDNNTLERLKAGVRNELDCQVCYALILDPLTTPCGHTFCRSCVAMSLNHSNLCPICRRKLNMSSSVQSEQINTRLSDIIQLFSPEEVASRRADLASELDVGGDGKLPLFVTSLSFPTMPIALHIFEARYRLMIQRVMESRRRKFGMVMPNRRARFQSGLGRPLFLQYGTVMVVDRYELLPDGRSLVIATGMSRFKVVSWELVDNYHVGKIQRVDDVSISEEEAQESRETAAVVESAVSTSSPVDQLIESMSTQQLFQLALDFVLKERRQGAPWLHTRVLLAYGALPTDPAIFPWWFATILPIWDEEKYALMSTTTVRQRLKITARWIKRLESRQWYVHSEPLRWRASKHAGFLTLTVVSLKVLPPPSANFCCLMTSRPSPCLLCHLFVRWVWSNYILRGLHILHAILHVCLSIFRTWWSYLSLWRPRAGDRWF